jgi:predicted metal-dependent hydrolase
LTERAAPGRRGVWARFKAAVSVDREALPKTLDLDGTSCDLALREHPRARHVRLKVLPPGRVEVVVPPGYDRRYISALLRHHEAWLARTVGRVRREWANRPVLVPPEALDLAALGECWRVEYRIAPSGRALCRSPRNERLLVHGSDEAAWRVALRRWLSRRAKAELLPWLAATSEELGLRYTAAGVRGQKTRWGSCSARGNISLNHGLLFLPPHLVRYLFVHELCHTRHLNHSARFWALVSRVEPEYRTYERELRRATRLVPPWLRGG